MRCKRKILDTSVTLGSGDIHVVSLGFNRVAIDYSQLEAKGCALCDLTQKNKTTSFS